MYTLIYVWFVLHYERIKITNYFYTKIVVMTAIIDVIATEFWMFIDLDGDP